MCCEICGNEIDLSVRKCPFCVSVIEQTVEQSRGTGFKIFRSKVVNLEQGLPFVDTAIKKMEQAIWEGQLEKYQALTFIHGYGSSGKGGAIREESRKVIDHMCSQKEITDYILGENFSRHNGKTRDYIRRYPGLRKNRNLGKANKGITIVFL